MKMVICAVCLAISGAAAAQECSTIPEKIPLIVKSPMAPPNAQGRQVDLYDIKLSGNEMTGKITLHGRGLDGCTIRDHPVKGTCEAGVLKYAAVIAPGDNRTCPAQHELRADKNWEGTYPGGTVTRR